MKQEIFALDNLFFHTSLKPPVFPDVSLFGQVIGDAFAVSVVGYGMVISVGRIFALKYGYKVDSNQVGRWKMDTLMNCKISALYIKSVFFMA